MVVLPFWEELFCAEDFCLVEAAFCCLPGDGVKATFGGLSVVRVCTEAESRRLSGAGECEKAVPERLSGPGVPAGAA